MSDHKAGSFEISLTIWQDDWGPELVSERLGLVSWFVGGKDQLVAGALRRNRGVWMATVVDGTAESEFGGALERVWSLISTAKDFFFELRDIDSEVELLMSFWVERESDPAQSS